MESQALKICLAVRRLHKHFDGREILREVTFELPEGEVLGIIGPNGAGKTTLFNIIAGSLAPSSGEVVFYDHTITHWPPDRRCRAGMARTFQIPQLCADLTVLENVMLGAWFGRDPGAGEGEVRDRAWAWLKTVGLEEKASSQARELTLMQQRLLELARALATSPRLLLVDEIAAGLSFKAVKKLTDLILHLRDQGLTLLLTDHLLHLVVPVSDRLLALDEGRIISQGPPTEVVHHPQVVAAYLGLSGPPEEQG